MNFDRNWASRSMLASLTASTLFLSACGGGGADLGDAVAIDATAVAVPGSTSAPSSGPTPTPTPAPTSTVSAELTWAASPTQGVAGYRVYYGTQSRMYLQAQGQGVAVGNASHFTVTGLPAGTTYYFVVTAVDVTGNESGPSNEAIKVAQ